MTIGATSPAPSRSRHWQVRHPGGVQFAEHPRVRHQEVRQLRGFVLFRRRYPAGNTFSQGPFAVTASHAPPLTAWTPLSHAPWPSPKTPFVPSKNASQTGVGVNVVVPSGFVTGTLTQGAHPKVTGWAIAGAATPIPAIPTPTAIAAPTTTVFIAIL